MEYTNLQKELLENFRYELPEEQLIDIKKIVQSYLINNIDNTVDKFIDSNNLSETDLNNWLNEDIKLKNAIDDGLDSGNASFEEAYKILEV